MAAEAGAGRPFAWERSYPDGVRWDAPLSTGTLPGALDRAVAAHGDLTAIEFREARITYSELGRRAARAAAGFARLGVGPGTAVALLLPNTPWHPIAFFGVLKAGGIVVHLTPLDPPRSVARKLADSGARILVTTNEGKLFETALAQECGGADVVVVGEHEVWGGEGLPIPADGRVIRWSDFEAEPGPEPARSVDDVAVLQYTGGTTGLPKAAMLTHGNLTAAISIYDAWGLGPGQPELGPGSRMILVLPLFHIYALTVCLLRSLSHGATLLMHARFEVEAVLRDIEQGGATVFPGVPTMWIALANHPGIEHRGLGKLQFASSGGAALPAEVQQRLERLTGMKLGGGWGMTETSPAGTSLLLERPFTAGAIGLPLPAIELDVVALDDPCRTLPPGETGELRIKGPNVFKGYRNRPEETATVLQDGRFLTGDVGYMDEDGCFFIVDRKKDMIISGGFNVYPRVIEDAIYEHPDVAEAAVVGVADPYRGQAAKAFVTLKAGAPRLTLEELRSFLADKIGRHEIPAALELRDALPRTPVGKLSRKELADEERARAALNA